MEDNQKRKVHRLELWEVAHKKKNGRYTTHKVDAIMEERRYQEKVNEMENKMQHMGGFMKH